MSVKIDALKSMGYSIKYFLKMVLQASILLALAVGIFMAVAYLLTHFFLYVLGAVFIIAMGIWFFIECQIAEQNLIYEEQSAKFVDKSNP